MISAFTGAALKGTKAEATKELRRLLKSGDDNQHVASSKLTLSQWVAQWLDLKASNLAGQTLDRYRALLEQHVVPKLGGLALQKIGSSEINALYGKLKLKPRTARLLHVVFKACLASAAKQKPALIPGNPMDGVEKLKKPTGKVGTALDGQQLAQLVEGFKGHSLYGIVCVGAYTGMRKGEILGLQWTDIDFAAKTISVSRSVEEVLDSDGKLQRGTKQPKTERGTRTFKIDDALCNLLRGERDRQLGLVGGIPEGADVDLSLIRLPKDALCFPAIGPSLTALRSPDSVYNMFVTRARELGFDIRFHDLRGTHATILLDKGVPVKDVAARIGDDAATLLKSYAKPSEEGDKAAVNAIATLTTGVL